jgi:hypothetical protein
VKVSLETHLKKTQGDSSLLALCAVPKLKGCARLASMDKSITGAAEVDAIAKTPIDEGAAIRVSNYNNLVHSSDRGPKRVFSLTPFGSP